MTGLTVPVLYCIIDIEFLFKTGLTVPLLYCIIDIEFLFKTGLTVPLLYCIINVTPRSEVCKVKVLSINIESIIQ
jgi:hypothetical protein